MVNNLKAKAVDIDEFMKDWRVYKIEFTMFMFYKFIHLGTVRNSPPFIGTATRKCLGHFINYR